MSKQNTSIEFEAANGDSIEFRLADDGELAVIIFPNGGERRLIKGLRSEDLEALRRWIHLVEPIMYNASRSGRAK